MSGIPGSGQVSFKAHIDHDRQYSDILDTVTVDFKNRTITAVMGEDGRRVDLTNEFETLPLPAHDKPHGKQVDSWMVQSKTNPSTAGVVFRFDECDLTPDRLYIQSNRLTDGEPLNPNYPAEVITYYDNNGGLRSQRDVWNTYEGWPDQVNGPIPSRFASYRSE